MDSSSVVRVGRSMKFVRRLSANISARPVRKRMLELQAIKALQSVPRISHPAVLYAMSPSSMSARMGGTRRKNCPSRTCLLEGAGRVSYCDTINFRTSTDHDACFHGFESESRRAVLKRPVVGGGATRVFRPDGVRFGFAVVAKRGLMTSVRSDESACPG